MRAFVTFPADNRLSLEITVQDDLITQIDYIASSHDISQEPNPSSLIKQITTEFCNYFKDPACSFTLQYRVNTATSFQQRVWQALCGVPSGETRTYSELAKQLHTSARAVGNACRANPIPIIIPCHRIISSTGIGGYAGDTLKNQKGTINYIGIKHWLLKHEQRLLKSETAGLE